MTPGSNPLISLVIPVFNEAGNVQHLWDRLLEVCGDIPQFRFEVVFVDDGSSDETTNVIRQLPLTGPTGWRLIQLSRNFGHQAAISAGMQFGKGVAIIFLDADLQDPPELIPTFLEKFAEGYDVVYGVRKNRKEPLWLRFCFSSFYRLFNSIAERAIPLDAGDFGLISRRAANLIVSMPEQDRLIRGLRSWVGFRQIGIPYNRPGRYSGTTRYGLGRRIEGALDGLFGFSKLPMRFAFFLGILVFLVCGIYLLQSYIGAFITGNTGVIGWRSIITLAFMLGGANLIAIAIVGEYVCRIYFQTKGRPLFIVISESESPENRNTKI